MKRWHLAGRLPYKTAVNSWRRALGVSRTNNEGTHRLLLAASAAGVAVLQYHGLTDAQCDAQSRRSRELNLARFLKKGYHGPWWTDEQLALLGKEPDDVVAARIGRTENAVRLRRQLLAIPNPRDRRKGRGRGSRTGSGPNPYPPRPEGRTWTISPSPRARRRGRRRRRASPLRRPSRSPWRPWRASPGPTPRSPS